MTIHSEGGDMAVECIEELLCRHDGQAYQLALDMLGGRREDASDAVQDARVSAWQYLDSFDEGKGDFCTWYLSIVRNACRRIYRRGQRSVDWPSLDDLDEIIATPLDQLIDRDERSYLRGAVDVLPPQQSRAVRMRYLEGLEYSEIAYEMGISEYTIRRYVSLGLKNLKERIGTVGAIGA